MLREINQKHPFLLPEIQLYGCLFLCFAPQSWEIFIGDAGVAKLNHMWLTAKETGIISKDNVILDHNLLLKDIFIMDRVFDGKHHKADEKIDPKVSFVFGEYFYKSSHFVIISAKDKRVVYDPLGISNTVKNGKLKSMRWYYAVKELRNLQNHAL